MDELEQSKFVWATASGPEQADSVILGVPDEGGSHADRHGVSQAPARIREVSCQREGFSRLGSLSVAVPRPADLGKRIYDMGDVAKENLARTVEELARQGKVPVTIGGDHSITAEALLGVDRALGDVSVVYFDAHPDFICSSRNYYGSVVCDINLYQAIDFAHSVEVGIRCAEPEELANLRQAKLRTITPNELVAGGVKAALETIRRRVGERVYISVDADVVDPSFAPGVSSPVPGGLTSGEMLYLLSELSTMNVVGLDVMEVCPPYDIQDMTSHLAARMIVEGVPVRKKTRNKN